MVAVENGIRSMLSMSPGTLIDVGCGLGAQGLYDAFSQARLFLYEFIDLLRTAEARGFSIANILSASPDNNGLVRFMDILFARQ